MKKLLRILALCLTSKAPSALGAVASWYGPECQGREMANCKPFDYNKLTCASYNYPLGTRLNVVYYELATGTKKTVKVTVTDRGPAKRLHRSIDLSQAAFARLAPLSRGLIKVTISVRK